MSSLAMLGLGEVRIITEIHGKEELKRHMQDCGFIKDENVQVVTENLCGVIVLIKSMKIALTRGLASKTIVA